MTTIFSDTWKFFRREIMEKHTIKLGQSLTIRNISESYALITKALEADHALSLDISEIQTIDTAGLQLFHILAIDCERHSITLNFTLGTSELENQCRNLGVTIPGLVFVS
ncbi:STAS domain-containing protein [Shewanella sp. NIFS-20-20]|uniref:STAS domain-containing protein n=1 Tax=Shewanella sp. NIFS-20-20 TaxID=2853806 RepID=UPI001C4695FF|nr:STAS domain-containing protein [Shewanella sp. NIFS-20-20]MBV7316939.1 STAS domain-containing protein [Shewanella sp. NIFS-20-20]